MIDLILIFNKQALNRLKTIIKILIKNLRIIIGLRNYEEIIINLRIYRWTCARVDRWICESVDPWIYFLLSSCDTIHIRIEAKVYDAKCVISESMD